jgi:L-iditol 2-dehydrogenase
MYKTEDYLTAIDLIQSDKIKLDPLISKHFPFEDYSKAYKYIEQNRDETLKVLIDL